MTKTETENIHRLLLAEIIKSATNRKTFVEEELKELSDSIRDKGVLQAILVRPVSSIEDEERRKAVLKAGAKYEIIFGERRWRASKMAEKNDIPAIIRPLNDREARALQLIENVQRSQPEPLEEAEQYNGLLESGEATVEEIAAEIGKSKATVYGLVSLLKLPKEIKEALRAKKITLAVALLIARIANPVVALEAGKRILQGRHNGQPFSVAEARHVLLEYMTVLKTAPFDPKDESLVPKAGPCASCPKRTGNQSELFGDVARKDTCTDPICFRAKCEAARARRLAQAEDEGKIVLSAEDSGELYPYPYSAGQLQHDAPVVELDQPCHFDHRKTWGEVISKLPAEERPQIIVAVDREGTIHELIGRKEAGEAAEALDLAEPVETQRELSSSEVQQKKAEKAARERHEQIKRAVDLAITAVIEKQAKAKDAKALFRLLRVLAITEANFDTERRVAKRHGFTTQKKDGDVRKFYANVAKEAEAAPVSLFIETLIWKNSLFVNHGLPEMVKTACHLFGVDTKKIEAAAKEKPAKVDPKANPDLSTARKSTEAKKN